MRKPSVEDALKEGMYGPKEIKPEERRQFLGTLRERVVIALKKSQVREQGIYPQVEQHMNKNTTAHLFLNGDISYEQLSKYVKLAKKFNIEHTIVSNKEHDTEIGLVLAMDHAIDKEEIYVDKKESLAKETIDIKKEASFFTKLFKWGGN